MDSPCVDVFNFHKYDIEEQPLVIAAVSTMACPQYPLHEESFVPNKQRLVRASVAKATNPSYFDITNHCEMAMAQLTLTKQQQENSDRLYQCRPAAMWKSQGFDLDTMQPIHVKADKCVSCCIGFVITSCMPLFPHFDHGYISLNEPHEHRSSCKLISEPKLLCASFMVFLIPNTTSALVGQKYVYLVIFVCGCVKKLVWHDIRKSIYDRLVLSLKNASMHAPIQKLDSIDIIASSPRGPIQATIKALNHLNAKIEQTFQCRMAGTTPLVIEAVKHNIDAIFLTQMTMVDMYCLTETVMEHIIRELAANVLDVNKKSLCNEIEHIVSNVQRRRCYRGCASIVSTDENEMISMPNAVDILAALHGPSPESTQACHDHIKHLYPNISVPQTIRIVVHHCVIAVIREYKQTIMEIQALASHRQRGVKRKFEEDQEDQIQSIPPNHARDNDTNILTYVVRNLGTMLLFHHLSGIDMLQLRMVCASTRQHIRRCDFEKTMDVMFPRGTNARNVPNVFYHELARFGSLSIHHHTSKFESIVGLCNVSNLKTNCYAIPVAEFTSLRSLTIHHELAQPNEHLDFSALPMLVCLTLQCTNAFIESLLFPPSLVILDVKCSAITDMHCPGHEPPLLSLSRLRVWAKHACSITLPPITLHVLSHCIPGAGWPCIDTRTLVIDNACASPNPTGLSVSPFLCDLYYLVLEWSPAYYTFFNSLHQCKSLISFCLVLDMHAALFFEHTLRDVDMPRLEAFTFLLRYDEFPQTANRVILQQSAISLGETMQDAFCGEWIQRTYAPNIVMWVHAHKPVSKNTCKFMVIDSKSYFPNR